MPASASAASVIPSSADNPARPLRPAPSPSGRSTLLLECAARPLAEFVIPEAAQEGGCEGVDPPGETRMVAALFVVGEVVALTQKPVPAQLLTFTQVTVSEA